MTTLWATIVVIGVLVFVHELGHYLAARAGGVRVDRFSVGFPPRFITFTSVARGWAVRLFFFRSEPSGKRTWGPVWETFLSRPGRKGSGTEYCLALIPLGGYVKMAGVIDESLDTAITHAPDELLSKPSWIQMGVMSAGVVMNVLLAFILFTGVIMKTGIPEVSDEPVVAQVVEGMPAEKIGLQPGDRIRSINGQAISSWTELSNIIHTIPQTPIELEIERKGEVFRQSVVTHYQVVLQKGRPDTLGAIGIAPEFYYRAVGFLESMQAGAQSTLNSFTMIVTSLRMLVTGEASLKDLGGPIMIAQLAGETAKAGWIPLLTFIALISVNLAFINILPIPGLDGGHILVTLVELASRRKLTIKVRLVIQQIGMAFLLLLMATIILNDISRLFTK